MDLSNLNRRVFLASSAAVAAGTGFDSIAHGQYDPTEVIQWKRLIGSRFQTRDDTLRLKSVKVTDYAADSARPRELRPYSISLLFVSESPRRSPRLMEGHELRESNQRVTLSPIVPPEGESCIHYEGIIN